MKFDILILVINFINNAETAGVALSYCAPEKYATGNEVKTVPHRPLFPKKQNHIPHTTFQHFKCQTKMT